MKTQRAGSPLEEIIRRLKFSEEAKKSVDKGRTNTIFVEEWGFGPLGLPGLARAEIGEKVSFRVCYEVPDSHPLSRRENSFFFFKKVKDRHALSATEDMYRDVLPVVAARDPNELPDELSVEVIRARKTSRGYEEDVSGPVRVLRASFTHARIAPDVVGRAKELLEKILERVLSSQTSS